MGYITAKEQGTGSEKAASAVNGRNKTEYLLCTLTFPEETGLLDKPCESCAIAKAKQKTLPKAIEHEVVTEYSR